MIGSLLCRIGLHAWGHARNTFTVELPWTECLKCGALGCVMATDTPGTTKTLYVRPAHARDH